MWRNGSFLERLRNHGRQSSIKSMDLNANKAYGNTDVPPMPALVVEFKAQYASELHSSEDSSDNVNEEGRENNFEV